MAHRRRRPADPGDSGRRPDQPARWLFTPIFQAMFIIMVGVYEFLWPSASRAIAWAIVVLTLVVRAS